MYDIACKWNLKNATNEPIYEIEIESQMYKTILRSARGKGGRGKLGDWD